MTLVDAAQSYDYMLCASALPCASALSIGSRSLARTGRCSLLFPPAMVRVFVAVPRAYSIRFSKFQKMPPVFQKLANSKNPFHLFTLLFEL
ncbi:MAG: hypothetical protein LBU81_06285 [Methanosarcinales archaeon]|nr:hypothetical protein [Methanosarcinales archaeon]